MLSGVPSQRVSSSRKSNGGLKVKQNSPVVSDVWELDVAATPNLISFNRGGVNVLSTVNVNFS
jgi:hypothetical protein